MATLRDRIWLVHVLRIEMYKNRRGMDRRTDEGRNKGRETDRQRYIETAYMRRETGRQITSKTTRASMERRGKTATTTCNHEVKR